MDSPHVVQAIEEAFAAPFLSLMRDGAEEEEMKAYAAEGLNPAFDAWWGKHDTP